MYGLEKQVKTIALAGIIGLTGISGCMINTDHASAFTYQNVGTVKTVSGAAITAATVSETTPLYPVHIQVDGNTKYGYIDNTGKMVIQPVYDQANEFSDGLAIVSNGGKYQVVSKMGKVIYQSENMISDFHNGLAAITEMKDTYTLTGYINTKGKVVIKPQFKYGADFYKNGTAYVLTKKNHFACINKKGTVLKTYSYKVKDYYNGFQDGYIIINDSKTYLQGVINMNGKTILKPIYGNVTYLGNGIFAVKKAAKNNESYLLETKPAALFNEAGKRLTDYKFYDLSEFNGKYASATDAQHTFFIGTNGQKITSLPVLDGRGTMKISGDLIQADIDYQLSYLKQDGTVVWKNDAATQFSSGIKVNSVKFKPNKYAVVYYPVIEGFTDSSIQKTVNDKMKNDFVKNRETLKEQDNVSVYDSFSASQIKDLLIIRKDGYDYYFGAAHGMPLRNYYFINVKTGDFYELKDLFKDKSDYVTSLSTIIKKQMADPSKAEEGMFFNDGFSKIQANQSFYISEDKLAIYFAPYEVAAYAAGFPEFNIPFSDIKDLINTDGAFWKSFH